MQASTNTTTLWTIEDIADFYRRSVRQARRIVREPGFPCHVRGDRFRWSSAAVVEFATTVTVPAESPDIIGPTATGSRIVRTRQRVTA